MKNLAQSKWGGLSFDVGLKKFFNMDRFGGEKTAQSYLPIALYFEQSERRGNLVPPQTAGTSHNPYFPQKLAIIKTSRTRKKGYFDYEHLEKIHFFFFEKVENGN